MIKDGAVLATFVDIKATKSRKVAVLWFEIPLEEASAALAALGGFPDAVNPKWVGIAPVDAQKVMAPPKQEKPKSYAQQVAILCGEASFLKFLQVRFYAPWVEANNSCDGHMSDVAAQVMRKILSVSSRSDIVEGSVAAAHWREIHREYEAWKLL